MKINSTNEITINFDSVIEGKRAMSDDLKIKQPQDPLKINLNESWEVDYWTKALGVSEAKLRKAVAAVGVMVKDVKEWLKNN